MCPLCNSRSPSLPLWLSHLRLVHRSDCDLSLRCPVDACSATYKKVNSFCSHMYRQHREIACTSTSATANPSHIMQNDSSGITEEHDSSSLINNPNMIEDLQHDIDHLLGTDSFEQRKKSSLFLLKLKEERVITQAAVNDVVKGCKEVFAHTVGRIKAGVKHRLSLSNIDPSEVSGLDDLFSSVNDPFSGLETAYLQDKFVAEELGYVVNICGIYNAICSPFIFTLCRKQLKFQLEKTIMLLSFPEVKEERY